MSDVLLVQNAKTEGSGYLGDQKFQKIMINVEKIPVQILLIQRIKYLSEV